MFISFEGIDGSGKTTLSTSLAQQLQRHGIDVVLFHKKTSPRGVDPYVERHLETLAGLIWHDADEQPIHLLGDGHWIRLMSAYFAAIGEVVVGPALASGRVVIADNWYYKFCARMTVNTNCAQEEFDRIFRGVVEPTNVVYLECDPAVAALRKGNFTKGEVGGHRIGDSTSEDGFVAYQSKVAEVYRSLALERDWVTVEVGDQPARELAGMVAHSLGLIG